MPHFLRDTHTYASFKNATLRSRMSTHLLLIMEMLGRSFSCIIIVLVEIHFVLHLLIVTFICYLYKVYLLLLMYAFITPCILLNLLSNNHRSLCYLIMDLLMCLIVLYHWYAMPLDSLKDLTGGVV